MGDILAEISTAFLLHKEQGSYLAGLHLEVSTENVTECVGVIVSESNLLDNYKSPVDPRLNPTQVVGIIQAFIKNFV